MQYKPSPSKMHRLNATTAYQLHLAIFTLIATEGEEFKSSVWKGKKNIRIRRY